MPLVKRAEERRRDAVDTDQAWLEQQTVYLRGLGRRSQKGNWYVSYEGRRLTVYRRDGSWTYCLAHHDGTTSFTTLSHLSEDEAVEMGLLALLTAINGPG